MLVAIADGGLDVEQHIAGGESACGSDDANETRERKPDTVFTEIKRKDFDAQFKELEKQWAKIVDGTHNTGR